MCRHMLAESSGIRYTDHSPMQLTHGNQIVCHCCCSFACQHPKTISCFVPGAIPVYKDLH
jgi:hypothetical protein